MSRKVRLVILGVLVCAHVAIIGAAQQQTPQAVVAIDQKVERSTLRRYHHTDQGTRIMPAAFLAALPQADGSGKVMSPENLRKWGFLTENVAADARNPYGWPLGFTVSDPAATTGIAVAGVTCALCHTGQLDYRGTAIHIEGGQANINLAAFQTAIYAALGATASDPARTASFLRDAVAAGYPSEQVKDDFKQAVNTAAELLASQKGLTGVSPGPGRVDAVQGIANAVFTTDLQVPANGRNLDAPVSYPYLWDIWRLTWLQYNGFLPPQALSRNIGEVLGVNGKTNFINPATGALNPVPDRWRTSVQMDNLIWMESVLKNLKAPTWPAEILGKIDQTKAANGGRLFAQHCASCHGIKELPNGNWDAVIYPLSLIGTDANQAVNWAGRRYDASKLGLGSAVPASALAAAVNAIRRQHYADSKTPTAEQESDVSFAAPCGYKARPLIGVWATPPFLHNGSVRTIYDLLSDTRPTSFKFGSRQYDPVNLGYVEDTTAGAAALDTSIPGNHNTGHWFTNEAYRPGRIGRQLSAAEKLALIEFIKSATYDNYPVLKVNRMQPVPCANNRDWAQGRSIQ